MKEITRHTKILDHNPKLPYLVCYQNHPMCVWMYYMLHIIYIDTQNIEQIMRFKKHLWHYNMMLLMVMMMRGRILCDTNWAVTAGAAILTTFCRIRENKKSLTEQWWGWLSSHVSEGSLPRNAGLVWDENERSSDGKGLAKAQHGHQDPPSSNSSSTCSFSYSASSTWSSTTSAFF